MDIPGKEYAMIGAVIIFGAIVHATTQLQTHRERKEEFGVVDFIILFVIACFSGLVFGLSAIMFGFGAIQVALSSAIGAFLGIVGLDKISKMILDILISRGKKNG